MTTSESAMGREWGGRLTWKEVLTPAAVALRSFGLAFVLIQGLAVGTVLLFYRWPEFEQFCLMLGKWKADGGLPFAALSTVFAAVGVSELMKAITLRRYPLTREKVEELLFLCLLYGIAGMKVDLFYRFQGWMWGDGVDVATVAIKSVVDQCVYAPFISLPYFVSMFLWKEEGYSVRRMLGRWSWGVVRRRWLPLYVSGAMYWVPILVCVYCLPAAVQFPLFLCAVAAWSLVLSFVAAGGGSVSVGEKREG